MNTDTKIKELERELADMTKHSDDLGEQIEGSHRIGLIRECELAEAQKEIVGWNNKWQVAIEMAAVAESERDGLHDLHNKNAARSAELLELCRALRHQRDELAEALETLERLAGLPALQNDPARVQARKALAAMKGGSHARD